MPFSGGRSHGEPQLNGSWHPSGHVLAFTERHDTDLDLMMLQVDGDETSGGKPGEPRVLLNGPFAETLPAFSPDGFHTGSFASGTGRSEKSMFSRKSRTISRSTDAVAVAGTLISPSGLSAT
jgi:WD40-like Beta Propeller Repeat